MISAEHDKLKRGAARLSVLSNSGTAGLPSVAISFHIGNAIDLFNSSSKSVFAELGGPESVGSGFDWGVPFFLGRSVFVGIEGKNTILGNVPYWAY